MILTSITNYLAEVTALYEFSQTPGGAFIMRILPALIVGIAARLILWELFGAWDSFLKDKYEKPFKRLAIGLGFIINLIASIGLTVLFKNGHTLPLMIAWGVLFGSISIVIQFIWEIAIWVIIKKKLKNKYKVDL